MKLIPRSSGVLLHPTSLPGPYGIGDLGPEAFRWVQTLASARQSWWQILPLGPTGAGNSPYQAFSAFAGNISLLSPELLVRDGLISQQLLQGVHFRHDRVEFEHALPFKQHLLRQAWNSFNSGKGPASLKSEFSAYVQAESSWLKDYSFFMAIRQALGGRGLSDWPEEVRRRDPVALQELEKQLKSEIQLHQFGEFLFERQWLSLKAYANEHGVKIIGDVPIFVSGDSSDMWANPELFLLDEKGLPKVVAGVPPDYFNEDGQHWGNPIYDWAQMEKTNYKWWVERMRRLFRQTDLVRMDHFRGFAQSWHILATEKTAKNGKWVDGPGLKLFEALKQQLGTLPVIAEDLGDITADVHELRKAADLPGMAVLQFALGGPTSPHWPHNFNQLTAVYTGTHDNDTTNGWFWKLNDHDRWTVGQYLGKAIEQPSWELIRLAWSSVASLAITPLQDLLELGSEARMNVPGEAEGNWGWRFQPHHFRPGMIERLAEMTVIYNRVTQAGNKM
jgi:4-alpha-glucanotransferase